jgi:GNAT superfamily N-acetyltransferase
MIDNMQIVEVHRTDRRDVRDFLTLPFRIYRDIPQWVPPLMPGERARFKPDYAFYRHSEAAFYLVRDETGRAVGRVAVLEHRPHNAYRDHKDALLYLYEAIDDDEVARLLFEAAAEWAKGRGLDTLVGPKGFMTGDGLGLLVEGFEHRPAIGVPYNPPYYPRQWEEVGGMAKELDYLSAYVSRNDFTYPERVGRLVEKIKKRRNFRVPVFNSKAEVKKYAEVIQKAYNSAFVNVWAYTPIPDEELQAITDRLLQIADPRLIKLIFKDDNLIGFQLAYPDISAGIQRIKGRIWPLGWLVLLAEKRRTTWLNVNGNAILPQYQGLGANLILSDQMIRTLLDTHYEHVDLVQVQENNAPMLADLRELTGADVYKRHRVYKRRIE